MIIDYDRAEYGVGVESLTTAMQQWAKLKRVLYITNVSRTDTFRDCVHRYYWDYKHGGVGVVLEDAEPSVALEIGSAIHDGAEVILQAVKAGQDPTWADIVEEACAAAQARAALGLRQPRPLLPYVHEKYESFKRYITPLMQAGASLLRHTDEVWATEAVVWACVPMAPCAGVGETWICVVGRLDAVVVEQSSVWHLQHKSREKEGDYDDYAVRLAFGAHETVYGWIMRETIARGLWGAERAHMNYAGSKVAVWLKQERPDTEPDQLQKAITDLADRGKLEYKVTRVGAHDEVFVRRIDCTDKQFDAAVEAAQRWNEREARRVEALRSYDQRAVQLVDVDLDARKMQLGFERQVYAAYHQAALDYMGLPDMQMPGNTNSCERWGRPCPHLESVTCGGWDDKNPFDPDSRWALRESDYVDEYRNLYYQLLQRESAS